MLELNSPKFWCAFGGDIVHFGKLDIGQTLTTGQPFLESFVSESELIAKVDSLKYAGYYSEHLDLIK